MSVEKELFHPKVTFLLLLFPLPFCIVQQLFQNPLLHSFEKKNSYNENITIPNDFIRYKKTTLWTIAHFFQCILVKQRNNTQAVCPAKEQLSVSYEYHWEHVVMDTMKLLILYKYLLWARPYKQDKKFIFWVACYKNDYLLQNHFLKIQLVSPNTFLLLYL